LRLATILNIVILLLYLHKLIKLNLI